MTKIGSLGWQKYVLNRAFFLVLAMTFCIPNLKMSKAV